MDAIEKAVAVLRQQIKDLEDGISVLLRLHGKVQPQANSTASGIWTPARRKAAGLRAKAAWRKRKAAAVQNRVTVAKVAAKKKG